MSTARRSCDEDFSGFGGLVKMFEVLSGADEHGKTSSAKKIAVIYAVGVIISGEGGRGMFGKAVGSDTIIEALQDAEEDPKVDGHRAAGRQPWRIGAGQRPDVARNYAHQIQEADRGQHGRYRGQRRVLHLDGLHENLRRAGHADRLDRRGQRQRWP